MKMKKTSTFQLTAWALFTALTAVLAQFSIPIGPVPISLATLAVYLAGGILGAAGGAASQAVYVLLGAVGVPVYAGFSGGAGVLAGPTGGYLVGYVVCAWIVGVLGSRFRRKTVPLVLAMILGTTALYFLGTVWFLFVTKRGLWESLTLCVFPFLPGDAAKIVVSALLAPQLGKVFDRMRPGTSAA
jgi:biotin transport system substrate-specific component